MIKMLSSLKNYKIFVVLSLLLTLVNVTTTLFIPYFFGQIIDLLDEPFERIFNLIIISLIFIFVSTISLYLLLLVNNYLSSEVIKEIRDKAFNKITKLSINYFDINSSSKTLNNVINNVDQYNEGLLYFLNDFIRNLFTLIGVFIFMATINIIVSLIVLCITPLSLIITRIIAKKSYKYSQELIEIRQRQTHVVTEVVNNQKNIINFNYKDVIIDDYLEVNEEYEKKAFKATFISSLVNPSTRFISSLVYATIILTSYILITRYDYFSLGLLASLLAYVNQYAKPFNELTSIITEIEKAKASYVSIIEYLAQDEDKDNNNELSFNSEERSIEFKDVFFSYNKDKKLIENFNLHVNSGDKIAIVGKTGAGKSTLINLLMRFYDIDSGDILINGNSILGHSKESLRKEFGMVLQDTWVKDDTIYNNLTMGNDYDPKEIARVLDICMLRDYIDSLPEGLNTKISQTSNLSLGQRQLLCIARVMLKNPNILLLDEATSNIDLDSEINITNSFNKLMKNKTTFIVAHRLKTIESADKIILLDEGKIKEIGTHQELLDRKGLYYNLYMTQLRGDIND